MKKAIASLSLITALAGASLQAADHSSGFVDFGDLTPGKKGSQFVEVNLSSTLISLAANFAKDEPGVAELLRGIESVRVNVIGMDEENRDKISGKISEIKSSLDKNKWERLVVAQEKGQDVGVYVKTQGSKSIDGVVVLVEQGNKQAVLVNVVGNISPEKLGIIGEKFGIDPLKNLTPKQAKKKAKAQEKEKEQE